MVHNRFIFYQVVTKNLNSRCEKNNKSVKSTFQKFEITLAYASFKN